MSSARALAHAWTALRGAAAVLALAAIAAPATVVIRGAMADGRDVATVAWNFFSFFTMTFNGAGAIVLLWAAAWAWSGRREGPEPRPLAVALATVTTCVLVIGGLYNIQLPGMEIAHAAIVQWSNVVLHIVMPLFFLADLLVGPHRRPLRWRTVLAVLTFPAAWTVYVLIRANLVTNTITGVPYWYPYPFLNPYEPGGYLRVMTYILAVTVVTVIGSLCVIGVGRLRARRRPRDKAASR
ncbi:Pr6Pr family membrane protein [Microbacterium sp. 1P10AE]|uniref:Pr6Pr family membrane protein n=1 Tax=Microbacterium sp. 1P10AE TaxID=3132286 RepID=UPI0039A03759